MKTAEEIKNILAYCYGSEQWHRWSPLCRKHVLSDGAKTVAEECGAYWLMDIIASYHSKVKHEEFQTWRLKVENRSGVVTCDDGNGNILVTQEIPFTDFPLDEIKIYCMLGSLDGVNPQWVIMLPSEN